MRTTRLVRTTFIIALAAAPATAGAVLAAPVGKVTGTYGYTSISGPKAVSLDAHAGVPVRGTWQFTNLASGDELAGPVSCLRIDGEDAWLAGPPTTGEAGVFIYVHDGGRGGGDDQAITWIQDPGQPFEELQGWCESGATHVERSELDFGNLTIHAGS